MINDRLSNGKWHFPWIQKIMLMIIIQQVYVNVSVCLCQLASIHIVQCLSIKLYRILSSDMNITTTSTRNIPKKTLTQEIGRPNVIFHAIMFIGGWIVLKCNALISALVFLFNFFVMICVYIIIYSLMDFHMYFVNFFFSINFNLK